MAILGLMFLASSCTKDTCTETVEYTLMDPIYMSYSDFRNGVSYEDPREMENPGKIYLYNNLFFVNEFKKGIHVYDISDKSNPINIGFINIIGNVDIVIKNGYLIADSFMDIITLDISDFNNIHEIDRELNVYSSDWNLGIVYDNQGVVIDYEAKEVVEENSCNPSRGGGIFWQSDVNFDSALESSASPAGATNNAPGTQGVGGSFARFALSNDYLYAIDNSRMHLLSLANPANPELVQSDIYISWNIETVFPYKDYLFFGSQNGMIVYDVSTPAEPQYVSQLQHFRGCDPVVVRNDIAYVTLRNGNPSCGGFENQLDIIDVSNISNPSLMKSYDMTNPHGLGIDENTLFLCDGQDGLKIFDVEDTYDIDQMEHYENINTYDVIPLDDVLFMVGEDGFYIYDYSDLDNISLLSSIQKPVS